jgi:hypothetical protein
MNIKRAMKRKRKQHQGPVTPEAFRNATWTRKEANTLIGKEFIWNPGGGDIGKLHGRVTATFSWACPCCGEKPDDPSILIAQFDSEEVMRHIRLRAPEFEGMPLRKQDWETEVEVIEGVA